jgi:hypothetical protein
MRHHLYLQHLLSSKRHRLKEPVLGAALLLLMLHHHHHHQLLSVLPVFLLLLHRHLKQHLVFQQQPVLSQAGIRATAAPPEMAANLGQHFDGKAFAQQLVALLCRVLEGQEEGQANKEEATL